jgi:polyisoprenoid-binding protein YceI
MKLSNMRTAFVAALFLSLSSQIVLAQTNYTMASAVELKVSGTSTLHDWDMNSQKATGKAVMTVENGALKGIQSLSVSFNAESLKSGKSQMDGNAYKALKTKAHPEIKYVLKDLKPGQGTTWTAVGDMTIAGVTKSITMPVTVTKTGDVFQFTGSLSTKLTEFKIDPPTAMLGTVKTGNDVKLSFSAKFNPSK